MGDDDQQPDEPAPLEPVAELTVHPIDHGDVEWVELPQPAASDENE